MTKELPEQKALQDLKVTQEQQAQLVLQDLRVMMVRTVLKVQLAHKEQLELKVLKAVKV